MRSISGLLGRSALLVAVCGALACGSDSIVNPTMGSGCNVGALHPGDTVVSAFNDSSCAFVNYFWSDNRVPYESYTVSLTKGKAYMFTESNIPDPAQGGRDDVDAQLTLWGKNANGINVPLAASDDEARGDSGLNSVIFFVAPTSGTFQLVATSYYWPGFGGYELTMNECPVLAVLDTAGTYALNLQPSNCRRVNAANIAADTSLYSFVSFQVDSFETVHSIVTSAAFTPDWEMFGPGMDFDENIYDYSHAARSGVSGGDISITMDEVGGQVTIGVGGNAAQTTGAFTLQLTRAFLAPPAPSHRFPGQLALKPASSRVKLR
ncbi:MAG TPA: hypothetical protein VL295_07175 [Gemmatimonadales bacterium]|jgi:hypothetical protein|nr:hypothetical protein [Gemmatimonadales bacterium]